MTGGGLYKAKHHVGQRVSAVHYPPGPGTCLGNGEVVKVEDKGGTGQYRIAVHIDGDKPEKTYDYTMSASGTSDFVGEPFGRE